MKFGLLTVQNTVAPLINSCYSKNKIMFKFIYYNLVIYTCENCLDIKKGSVDSLRGQNYLLIQGDIITKFWPGQVIKLSTGTA